MGKDKEKKGGKIRKFFLFTMIAGLIGAVVAFVKRRRGGGFEESDWQELPPPANS
jgi:hypothetical protein